MSMLHQIDLFVEVEEGQVRAGLDIDCVSSHDAECRDERGQCQAVEFFGNCEHGAVDMYSGDSGQAIETFDNVYVWQDDAHEWRWKLQVDHDREVEEMRASMGDDDA